MKKRNTTMDVSLELTMLGVLLETGGLEDACCAFDALERAQPDFDGVGGRQQHEAALGTGDDRQSAPVTQPPPTTPPTSPDDARKSSSSQGSFEEEHRLRALIGSGDAGSAASGKNVPNDGTAPVGTLVPASEQSPDIARQPSSDGAAKSLEAWPKQVCLTLERMVLANLKIGRVSRAFEILHK